MIPNTRGNSLISLARPAYNNSFVLQAFVTEKDDPLKPIGSTYVYIMFCLMRILLPVATGLTLAIAFPPYNQKLLAWIALVPLGISMRGRSSVVESCLGCYVGGLVFQLMLSDWVRSGYGESGLSGSGATRWLVHGMGLAVIWPIVMLAGRGFIRRTQLPMAISLAMIWVSFEFVRKHLWSVVDVVGYPFGQLGLTQTDYPRLIQIADLGGVYFVSFLLAAINGLVVDVGCWLAGSVRCLSTRALCRTTGAIIGALCLILLYGTWRISQVSPRMGPVVCLMPSASVSAIGTAIGGSDGGLGDAIATCQLHDNNGRPLRPDLLVWSEGAYSRPIASPREGRHPSSTDGTASGGASQLEMSEYGVCSTLDCLEQFASDVDTSLVIGCVRIDNDLKASRYNSAAVVGRRCGYIGCYDKLRLVPFTEFLPPGRPAFGTLTGDRFVHGTKYPVFTIDGRRNRDAFCFAITICYDTCFPEIYWPYLQSWCDKPVPQFFVAPAYEAHDSEMRLQEHLLRMVQFRAIECRRGFIRNAKAGYSCMIDGNGRISAKPSAIDFSVPTILGHIPIDDRIGLYSVLGDWLPLGAIVAIVLIQLRQGVSSLSRPLRNRM